jgi:hypothetical protein
VGELGGCTLWKTAYLYSRNPELLPSTLLHVLLHLP